MSRRGFIESVGTGAVGIAIASNLPVTKAEDVTDPGELTTVTLVVNGRRHRLQVEPRTTLLHVLRDRLGMTGTKLGCDRGECGACSVLIDDVPRYSCLTLALEAENHKITTIEGLMDGERLGLVQQAFVDEDALQCGYCTPGQVVAAEGLLREHANPDIEQIREAMSGNLCRCGAYCHIFKAVQRAAERKRTGA